MNNTLSDYLRELKNKGKVQLRELFITKYESQFKRGSTKVIVTRVVARRTSTVPLLVGDPRRVHKKKCPVYEKKKSRLP